MSYIEDFFKNDFLKSLLFPATMMPFWYLSIYMINNEFYLQTEMAILIIICYVICLTSLLMMSSIISLFDNDFRNRNDPHLMMGIFLVATIFLLVWKVILFFLAYSTLFFFDNKLYYYWYIVIYFIPLFVLWPIGYIYNTKHGQD